MANKIEPDPQPQKPGPEADRLKIEGDWEDVLKEALDIELPKQASK